MNVSLTMETEEDLLTCLQIKLYHPQQSCKGFYGRLPLGTRRRHAADDPLRLGRDDQACAYILVDPRVSRKQLALYAYHIPQSSEMLFIIQNLSQRGKLSVNTSALGYLERMDLPDKALIRFGEYEILIIRESGEAMANFEVEFEVLAVPPSRETSTSLWKEQTSMSLPPVMETCSDSRISLSPKDSSFGPQESDETLPCYS
ncbi:TRAF-interacting protein with FHA domain-containing protein A-like [Simochromis diagramma]|uniref:TRAF-interacting protein with FHA domain-containing protein A-like n=1 Tax=Simochromis diagramma TaxID=43689 RepID=UPI001A7EB44E|nr:TRAF-interacting protein with FHA domain-containing protein A-like [Simochromis diagramma]XP_039896651.1 TRAF-interacting protein with FHA domain-containing protein A-like [Simochromis diagramma]